MYSIFDTIAADLGAEPIDLLVHVGAGPRIDAGAARLRCARTVLVDGEPANTGELARHSGAPGADVAVVTAVVSAYGDVQTWHRCSLPWLSGLRDPSPLRDVYPQLTVVDREAVATTALNELLAAHVDDSERRHLLVLDIPGLARELLASVEAELLGRFEWVAVRTCSDAAFDGELAAGGPLAGGSHRMAASNAALEPLWPTTLLRCDPALLEATRLKRELADAQRQLHALTDEAGAAGAENARLAAEVARMHEACARSTTRIAALADEVQALRNEQQELLAAHERQLHAVRHDAEAVRAAAAAKHDDIAGAHSDLLRTLVLAWRRQRRAEWCWSQQAQSGGSAAEVSLADTQRQLADSQAAVARHEARAHEGAARQRIYEDQMLRAGTRIDFIKDLLLRPEAP